jgi:hypothetical protein
MIILDRIWKKRLDFLWVEVESVQQNDHTIIMKTAEGVAFLLVKSRGYRCVIRNGSLP